ncbi:hypothetical protein GT354_10870 [Streptomyces sp. SID3343]|nr:hypothetical protein [Streptomyces sp. SID3343]
MGKGGGADPFAGYVFDEDFVRGATTSEGSARARMLAQRWRESPPEPAQPWRAGPAPRTRRGSRVKLLLVVVVVIVVAAVALDLGGARHWFGGGSSTSAADDPLIQPQVTGSATSVPSVAGKQAVDPDTPTRADPFAGSPALNYADNEAGLTLPDAKAVPGYTAREVSDALALVRRLLVAGNLDRSALMGGAPTAYLGLLDPEQDGLQKLQSALTTNAWDPGATTWVTRFDAAEVELVGAVVKVNGVTSYATDVDGMLTVHADYSFVYPVARPHSGPAATVTRSVVRRVLDTTVYKGPKYTATPPGKVWITQQDVDISNSSCNRLDGFVRPEFSDQEGGSAPSGAAKTDPYDRSKPIQTGAPGQCLGLERI